MPEGDYSTKCDKKISDWRIGYKLSESGLVYFPKQKQAKGKEEE